MYTKLSIPERLKDLRVVDKHLTLEQLAEQTGLSHCVVMAGAGVSVKYFLFLHIQFHNDLPPFI